MTTQREVASGGFRFVADTAWAKWPTGWGEPEVTSIATDSQDRVFAFNRGHHPVAIFDREGHFLQSWGTGVFARPHGIYIDSADIVYCTDDIGHTVSKFTPDGRMLFRLGKQGEPSDTGATSIDYRTIRHSGPPFHFPTNLAVGPTGDLFITDGYGNARVHHFTAAGELLTSWGTPGAGPSQFHVPHGIAIDAQGTIYVCDRENSRLQLFSPTGEFLTEWTDIARPCDLDIDRDGNIYVAELGYRGGMWPGQAPPFPGATGGRVSIFSPQGKILARFGGGDHPHAPGDFFTPHSIWIDGHGDFYLSEVCYTAGKNVPPPIGRYHTLQKFSRI